MIQDTDSINPKARINLPKDGMKILMRVCKAGMKCTYSCEYKEQHIVSLKCFTKCCDIPGKDVMCVSIE